MRTAIAIIMTQYCFTSNIPSSMIVPLGAITLLCLLQDVLWTVDKFLRKY